MKWLTRVAIAVTAWLALAAVSAAQAPTARAFAQAPSIRSASLSPDGSRVALIQRFDDDEALVIVDWRAAQARPVQVGRRRLGVFFDWIAWKNDNRLLFAAHQRVDWSGSPDDVTYEIIRRVYAMNPDGSAVTQMFEGQMRRLAAADYAPMHLVDIQHLDAENVLFGTWGQRGYTVYRANVETGRATVVDDDSGWDTGRMYVDGDGNPVLRADWLPYASGYRYFRRSPDGGRWQLAHEVRRSTVAENRDFNPLAPGPGAGLVYVAARPEGQEYQAIYLYDTRTGELGDPVYEHPGADANTIRVDPNDNTLLAGCGTTQRWECRAVDPELQRHFEAISAYFEGRADFGIMGVSQDKSVWLLGVEGPTIPSSFYVYDLARTAITPVGSAHPQIPRDQLAETQVVRYVARDGTPLWGYLTVPRDRPSPPLVVFPHGGPESRDFYGYNFIVQFMVSRGYAVFQPNFRGSEGSGRAFAVAGYRQWGRLMQDDVTDGVRHLIESGAIDRERICIVGASYGGYVALAGGAFTPELYRCVVGIAPDSDLIQMLDEERRLQGRGSLGYAYWVGVVGDPNADREILAAVSPARHAGNFRAPVLLLHGKDDFTVQITQSETMRDALQRAGRDVRFVEFEHEGHYFAAWEPENRQRMLEEIEAFLARHLQ